MRLFYILIIIITGSYLIVQTVAQVFYGKRFFPDAGELFTNKKDKNLWQTVFPKNMLRLIIVLFFGAVTGLVLDAAGMVGWLTMPIGLMAGIVVNFMISTVFEPIYDKRRNSAEPSDEELCELEGRVIEEIAPDNFGVIEVKHGVKNYLMRAVSANGRTLKKGVRVYVIYAQDGCCFVESEEHFFDVLFEEDETEKELRTDKSEINAQEAAEGIPDDKESEDPKGPEKRGRRRKKKDKFRNVDL